MTTYFISRHAQGSLKHKVFNVDQRLAHFDVTVIQPNDRVIGTLPINLVADVNARGGYYRAFDVRTTLPKRVVKN